MKKKPLNRQEIAEKINKIKIHKSSSISRVGLTLLGALENGIDFDDEKRLFEMVRIIYRSNKHRKPAWIKHEFMRTYKWLRKEFGYSAKRNPFVTKKFPFSWIDRINVEYKKGGDRLIPQKLAELHEEERMKILGKLNM